MEIIHTTNLPRQSGNAHHFSCLHEQPEIPLLNHLSQHHNQKIQRKYYNVAVTTSTVQLLQFPCRAHLATGGYITPGTLYIYCIVVDDT